MADRSLVHVVDDEAPVRRSLEFLLRTSGYSARTWESGEAFLSGADKFRPACVILDMQLPGRNGPEVQQAMAHRGLDFPVIILTGQGDISSAVRAMQTGASDFLEKPVDKDRLLRALTSASALIVDRAHGHQQERSAQAQVAKLTSREIQTLEGLASGLPNKAIAYDLGISSRTVEVYRASIMRKLEVSSFADALRIAFAAGLGSLPTWNTPRRTTSIFATASCDTKAVPREVMDKSEHHGNSIS